MSYRTATTRKVHQTNYHGADGVGRRVLVHRSASRRRLSCTGCKRGLFIESPSPPPSRIPLALLPAADLAAPKGVARFVAAVKAGT